MTAEPSFETRAHREWLLVRQFRALLAWGPSRNGRVVLFVCLSTYLSAVAASRVIWHFDPWPLLGVPSGPSLFFDARNLTAAWECQRLGYDPLYQNPCDPWRRPLMYLRPWLALEPLGLDQGDTQPLSIFLITAMFVSLGLLVGRVPVGTGVVLAVAACSPAVMFAVERANMDVALFSLISAAILLWRVIPRIGSFVSPLLVVLAASAKIYPVFALLAFLLTRNSVASRMSAFCMIGFTGYVGYAIRDIAHVAAIATQGDHFSYGARILPAHLYHQIGADQWNGSRVMKQLIAGLPLAVLAAVIIFRIHRRLAPATEESNTPSDSLLAVYIGALIYIGTFATANNFDYRLVFLMLTLPQLTTWARTPSHRLSSLAAVTVLAILVLLWIGSLSGWLNLWDELASWAVAGLLAAIVASSAPTLTAVWRSLIGPSLTTGPGHVERR